MRLGLVIRRTLVWQFLRPSLLLVALVGLSSALLRRAMAVTQAQGQRLDAKTWQRGFALIQRPAYSQSFDNSTRMTRSSPATMRISSNGTPSLRAEVEAPATLARAWFDGP